jgi:hypothetical protein
MRTHFGTGLVIGPSRKRVGICRPVLHFRWAAALARHLARHHVENPAKRRKIPAHCPETAPRSSVIRKAT